MKSTLVMRDIVTAKELNVTEMSAVRGGMSSLIRSDDYCGTRIPKPCIPPPGPFPWPSPGPTFPTGPIVLGPIASGLPV